MIAVNIRGTGGSGKSTLVRRVMDQYSRRRPVHVPKRKRPIGYELVGSGLPPLFVPGHYETACGGCDTIKTPNEVYELVWKAAEDEKCVLYEGIMVMDDVQRAVAFSQAHPLLVVGLTTPIDVCLRSIEDRRREAAQAKGQEPKTLDPTNTRTRAERQVRILLRLEAAGVRVERTGRDDAFTLVMDRLKKEVMP